MRRMVVRLEVCLVVACALVSAKVALAQPAPSPAPAASSPAQPAKTRVTVDDLMRLRSTSDVRISPDGRQVAYIVSTPSMEQAAHVPALYVVPAEGGPPRRYTFSTAIFNRPLPAGRLRWSPDGRRLSFIAFVDGLPQVVAMDAAGGEPRPLTTAKEGVGPYEWAPDSRRIAYVAPTPMSAEEAERRRDRTHVIHVGRDRHADLAVQGRLDRRERERSRAALLPLGRR